MSHRFVGTGLVVAREGISTPSAPYLREGPEQCWKFSGRGNSGGASPPRAASGGGAWVHAPPQEKPKRQSDLGRFLLLSLSAPALPVAGSGVGENEGMRAARRCSRWLREGSVRAGATGDEEESVAPALPCVDCGLTGEDGAAAVGVYSVGFVGEKRNENGRGGGAKRGRVCGNGGDGFCGLGETRESWRLQEIFSFLSKARPAASQYEKVEASVFYPPGRLRMEDDR
ncbi:hypothetical protein NC652_040437 [Populus alba x Populus x berolinensis]|nr:hypothetical protein NC652_040437 [Populus alba x Populus x berolinensis]